MNAIHKHPIIQGAALFKQLFDVSASRFCFTLSLMLLRSFTAGFGLLLILPLLYVISIPVLGHHGHTLITQKLGYIFSLLHLDLNLVGVLCLFLGVQVVVASFNLFQELSQAKLKENIEHSLRRNVYTTVLGSKWGFFVQKRNSDILHSLTAKIGAVTQAYSTILQLTNNGLLIFGYVVVSMIVSWQMTLIAILVSVGLLFIMTPVHKKTTRSGNFFLRKSQDIFQSFYEQINAIKLIKSSHAESQFIEKMLDESLLIKLEMNQFSKLRAGSKWLYTIAGAVAFCRLLYVAIKVIELSVASLLVQLVLFAKLLPMISGIQQNYQQLLHLLPSCQDLKEMVDECKNFQEVDEGLPQLEVDFNHLIEFKKVSFSYQNDHKDRLIENFSCCIEKNTTTAIIGPSGIGKSTFADLVVGLLEPTAGSVLIDNKMLGPQYLKSWRKLIAYVPQDAFLFNDTLRHNLEMFCGPSDEEKLWQALTMAAAEEFVSKLAKGLDTVIGDRGVRLSGGERQRIALARALLLEPKLLILDESTNSLDPQNIQHIQTAIQSLQGTMTILIISHQKEMSDFADKTIRFQFKKAKSAPGVPMARAEVSLS